MTFWIRSQSLICSTLDICPCQTWTKMNPYHLIKSIDKRYFSIGLIRTPNRRNFSHGHKVEQKEK